VIFVTVGSSNFPFDRLLQAVDALELDDQVIVQVGVSSVRPRRATCVGYLPFCGVVEHVIAARHVVTHAGVGSILVALANDKRPLVIPRLARFAETVDDHQLDCAKRFAVAGLVTLVEDPSNLQALLESEPAEALRGEILEAVGT
jgi:UDP-N-acetylglucosamine transferase subunit ALG13